MPFKFKSFFPYPSVRDAQSKAIDFCLDSFINQKKRFVVVEAGTGVGKSAVGVTVSRYLNANIDNNQYDESFSSGAWFVTTQKILQDQYVSDFGPSRGRMCSVKSSSNYKCSYHKGNSCQESQRALRAEDTKSRFFKACTFNCHYKNAKRDFIDSTESVTNFPYFLTEAKYSGKITPRNLLVVDEAHNLESELSKFIEIIVSERFCKHTLKLQWPRVNTQFQAVRWIKETYFPKAKSQLNHFEKMIKQTGLKSRLREFTSVAKQYDLLKSHVEKIDTFLRIYNKENWVMQTVPAYGRSLRKFSFRAIDISPFAQDYLFCLGKRVLMMSATILDKDTFCKSLNIPRDEVSFISIPSPFPAENRPIYFFPIGSMSSKNIEYSLPKMAQAVKEILSEHPDEKGIIHCHTFKIANYLKKKIRSKRLLIHTSENRDAILQEHITSSDSTVLLSPSMSEGVDLKGDLSRFQIIMKIPYPYLGDPLIKKRMNKWEGWYSLQTAKSIVQSSGRSIRSNDDTAVTYILDSDWTRFYGRNRSIFPVSFKECLK